MGLIRGALSLVGALLKTAVALIVIGVGGYFVLTHVFGMRLELSGTGMMPMVSFTDPDHHMAELERERAEQPPVPIPEPVVEEAAPPAEAVVSEAPAAPVPAKAPAAPPAWPDFRGAKRDGVIEGVSIRTDWPLEEVWRTNVGGGYASMVVAEGNVYTIEQRRDQEVVAAYQIGTGLEVWTHGWKGQFEERLGGPGPRATPTYADGKIYALGAEGELRCLRAANGELIWKTNILSDSGASNLQWAMSGAPLVTDGRVIVNPGGEGTSLAAYDTETGKIRWQSLDDKAGYTSPQLMTLAGVRQALIVAARRLIAFDPGDGRELWAFEWPTSNGINASQPVQISDNQVWISSGYGHGSALLEIHAADGGFQVEKLWETNTMKNKFNSSVVYEGHIYGLDDGILASIDVKTGARDWKGGRYGFGQLLLADGYLIVLTERGTLALVKATPESYQELANFRVLDGKTWNVPAFADGLLLVRNQTEMAAYRLSK